MQPGRTSTKGKTVAAHRKLSSPVPHLGGDSRPERPVVAAFADDSPAVEIATVSDRSEALPDLQVKVYHVTASHGIKNLSWYILGVPCFFSFGIFA